MFRVVDLRAGTIRPEVEIQADSPEEAAAIALGVRVFRGGSRENLVCRVYWESRGNLNMVRLYSAVEASTLRKSRPDTAWARFWAEP